MADRKSLRCAREITVNEVDLAKALLTSQPKKGPIGFQDQALPLWLKDIKIREL